MRGFWTRCAVQNDDSICLLRCGSGGGCLSRCVVCDAGVGFRADGIVHVLDGVGWGNGQVELVAIELLIEVSLAGRNGDGETEFIERTLNVDVRGEDDVAEVPVV